jgi:hypothetical protein
MKIYDIRVMAQDMGINPKKMNKVDLIRAIQIREGNSPCYRTAGSSCDQTDCLWRGDCLKQVSSTGQHH